MNAWQMKIRISLETNQTPGCPVCDVQNHEVTAVCMPVSHTENRPTVWGPLSYWDDRQSRQSRPALHTAAWSLHYLPASNSSSTHQTSTQAHATFTLQQQEAQ